MRALLARAQELRRYPSAILGLAMICTLVILAVYAMATMPYREAVRLWQGGEGVWDENPRLAKPSWFNAFRKVKLPPTIVVDSAGRPETKQRIEFEEEGEADVLITLAFDYQYDVFPKELAVYLTANFEKVAPFASFIWRTPDGREFPMTSTSVRTRDSYRISQDRKLQAELGGRQPEIGLLAADPWAETPVPLKGRHELIVDGIVFEPGSDLDARLVVYGQVHGIAGTDHLRRDITVALLWGTPIALCFGLLAAVGSMSTTMVLAATGSWYGRWVDGLLQRLNELVMILPMLPILVMVGTLYSRSIWLMLGLIILLSIFGGALRIYRAMFLQTREAPYIEAARAYGAGNLRIIFLYLIPRIIPVLVPQFVSLIPTFVFLEATLSLLGLGDPTIPTWGKVLNDASQNGALFMGHYYWVLAPSLLLIFTGLGFAMLGFALDRVFNPRLREQ